MSEIYNILNDLNISYTKYDHPAVFTVEESNQHKIDMLGGHTKNLFLRNKNGDRHYLVTIEAHKRADLKKLQEFFGEAKLSFASPERLQEYLGLTPGSVSLLGLVNDTEHAVRVLIDEDLFQHETINCHPNINTATLSIRTEDVQKFLKFTGHEVQSMKIM